MRVFKLSVFAGFLPFAALLLAGCGVPASITTTAGIPGTGSTVITPKGNWLVAGSMPDPSDQSKPAGIAISFDIAGSAISATYSFTDTCSGLIAPTTINSGAIQQTGTIAANGTFTLGSFNSAVGGLVITGTAPAPGATSWAGMYTLATGTDFCPTATTFQSNFTATPFADVSGTYTGSAIAATRNGLVTGPNVPITMTITLQQGGTYTSPQVASNLPLTGTIQIQGTTCYSHGTTTAFAGMIGNSLQAAFTMDDGSPVFVDAYVTNPTSTTLSVADFTDQGGKCPMTYVFATPLLLKQ